MTFFAAGVISLAAGSAIYICGEFGGAAQAVGQLLGLGSPWFDLPDCLRVETHGSVPGPWNTPSRRGAVAFRCHTGTTYRSITRASSSSCEATPSEDRVGPITV